MWWIVGQFFDYFGQFTESHNTPQTEMTKIIKKLSQVHFEPDLSVGDQSTDWSTLSDDSRNHHLDEL